MEASFKEEIDSQGIARLTFDLPGEKVNTFSIAALEELDLCLQKLERNPAVKLLVLASGKPDSFIAGADLRSFAPAFSNPELLEKYIRKGHAAFTRLQNLPFPSVAVIHGTCLGGGLECALACSFRLVTDHPKTILGLPETSLGIIPGWGGTQRLPRLVGLVEGLGMILSGRRLPALKAWKIHLADAIVAAEFKEEKVAEFLQICLEEKGRKRLLDKRKRARLPTWLLEENPLGRKYVFFRAKKDTLKKTKGHYPAPIAALEVIEKTYPLALEQGLEIEIQRILQEVAERFSLALTLIQLFFTQEALKKETGVGKDVKPRVIKTTGVIGAGIMGSGIAWLLSNNNFPVRMKDISEEAVGKGLGAVYELYQQNVNSRRMPLFELPLKFQKVSETIDYSGFKQVDLIIEAAVEDLHLKLQILQELEQNVRPDAIIATNTSSLTLAQMSPSLAHPERFVGMHFFNPVNRMPLVEIVKGKSTSPEVVATAVEFCKKLGKTPIVVKDCPGFLINRIFVKGANEILWMFQEGVEMERLEKVMADFGMPMSPFLLADEVGNDVGHKVSKVFEEAYGARMQWPQILQEMSAHKLFGKKVKKGFYLYELKGKVVNPEIKNFVNKNRELIPQLTDTDIRNRALLAMINEAAFCLEEKIIESPPYLDMAMIMGTGFPAFRGGPLRFADDLGLSYIQEELKILEDIYGPRYAIAPLLRDMAVANKKFYA